MPLLIDIKNNILENNYSINSHTISYVASEVLNIYLVRSLRKMKNKDIYAKNISEFLRGEKPLPKKFEYILLRQIAMSDYKINKTRRHTPLIQPSETIENTTNNTIIGRRNLRVMRRSKSQSFGGKGNKTRKKKENKKTIKNI